MRLLRYNSRCKLVVGLVTALVFSVGVSELMAQPKLEQIVEGIHYRSIGPTRQGGRVVAFAVSQQNPYTFYAAAGPAGVFKTENNGTTFYPVFDHENIASVGDVAVAPSDDNIVWIGSGEANLRNSTYYGNGVYKSVDGAKTWQHMGLEESHHIGRVLVHQHNPEIVYVAAQGHYYSENSERGIYKSVDGGKTWTKSLDIKEGDRHIGATEVRMDPNDSNILYGITYDRLRTPWSFRTRGTGSAIYKSMDAGNSWVKLTNGLPSGALGKIGIDIYPKNSNILYATVDVAQASGGGIHEIYRSDDAGNSWRRVSAEGESVGGRSNYYGQIIIDPNNDQHIYVLGTIVHESYDGGKTWGQHIKYGGDNHALWIDPNNSNHMIMGYDYGMAISHDAGKNWYHPDELPMGQFYAIGVDMDYPYSVYGGTQDFGSWKGPSTKKGRFPIRFEDWEHVNGGDGFYNLVDPNDSKWLYTGSQFGHITRVNQKSGARKTIMSDETEGLRFNWNTPLLISPHNSNTIYVGAQKLLRSSDRGDNWDTISPELARVDVTKKGFGPFVFGTITTVDESPVQEGVIWVGTDNGHVYQTTDAGKNWINLDKKIKKNPGYWVTRVTASNHDAGTAYITYSGFRRDDFRPFVYKTIDFGKTWISISNGLPNASVNVIKEDHKNPNLLFIGTDKAVYCSLNGGENWLKLKNNMPTVAIHDLVIHPRENDLVVGTHGRSIYIADISILQELSTGLLNSEMHLFQVEPRKQWRMNSQPAVSAQNFSGENEPPGVVINYYLKNRPKDKVKITIYKDDELIYETLGTYEPGLNQILWGMIKQVPRTEEEQKEWEQFEKLSAEEDEFFDYYDTVEIFPMPEEEVDKYGRSLRTRVHPRPGLTVKEYNYTRVPPGKYKVVLSMGELAESTEAILLEDHHDAGE
ncbi:sialidase family protein [Ulvibacterium sp.]|uniref:WD40/YVTN/BNR-like repeat-containing protein n=1 Tax=Ulvibacterium sp. TaxID=2665914 RepID=UPI00261D7846|nr:sialidase family protein [Ulvibacterium sp.]